MSSQVESRERKKTFVMQNDFLNLYFPFFQVHINLGAGESEISSPRGLRLDDLKWHEVKISRTQADLTLTIDRKHTSR